MLKSRGMSSKPPNVFISWSGARSMHVAEGFTDWIPAILQAARPWMSQSSIDKGARGLEEIGKALSDIKIGIVCLTPENLDARWILYEAGALSKSLDVKTRLCTYLLAGLEHTSVVPPLGMFQATRSDKDDTKKLIKTVNTAITDEPLSDHVLDKLFEKLWPELEQIIQSMPKPDSILPAKRTTEDMIAEMLEMMRADAGRRKKVDFMDAYIPMLQKFFPLVEAFTRAQSGMLPPHLLNQLHAPIQFTPIDMAGQESPKVDERPCPTCGNTISTTGGLTFCPKCSNFVFVQK